MQSSTQQYNREPQLAILLGYFGLVPFVAMAICRYVGIFELPFGLYTNEVLTTYALVIITFMTAIHWGQATLSHRLANSSESPTLLSQGSIITLVILSNVITLSGWFAYLLLVNMATVLIVDVILFVSILMIDYYLMKKSVISKVYFNFRIRVTVVVIASLVLSAFTTGGL